MLRSITLAALLTTAAAELAIAAPPGAPSLCARLGGSDAVSAVVKSFLTRMRADDADKLGRFWLYRGSDGVAREEQLIVDFVQSATGCGRLYMGRPMAAAHRGMKLSAKDWDRTASHLVATMNEYKVPPDLQAEVIGLVATTRPDIVECEQQSHGCR